MPEVIELSNLAYLKLHVMFVFTELVNNPATISTKVISFISNLHTCACSQIIISVIPNYAIKKKKKYLSQPRPAQACLRWVFFQQCIKT